MSNKTIIWFVWGLVAAGIIGIPAYAWLFWRDGFLHSGSIDPTISGQFGDLVGGLFGTLFALAVLLLVWLTYRSQERELNETRKILGVQQFESTFFNLLNYQRQITEAIRFDLENVVTMWDRDAILGGVETEEVQGTIVFQVAREDFSRLYINEPGLIQPQIHENSSMDDILTQDETQAGYTIPKDQPLLRIKARFKKLFDVYHDCFAHYFRHLYQILRYLHEHKAGETRLRPDDQKAIEDKYQFYANIVQSQLSSAEQYMLFYDGLCFSKMKALIEEFRLLENLAREDLADQEHHINLYQNFVLKSRYDLIEAPVAQ